METDDSANAPPCMKSNPTVVIVAEFRLIETRLWAIVMITVLMTVARAVPQHACWTNSL